MSTPGKTGLEHHDYGMAEDHRHHPSKKPETKNLQLILGQFSYPDSERNTMSLF